MRLFFCLSSRTLSLCPPASVFLRPPCVCSFPSGPLTAVFVPLRLSLLSRICPSIPLMRLLLFLIYIYFFFCISVSVSVCMCPLVYSVSLRLFLFLCFHSASLYLLQCLCRCLFLCYFSVCVFSCVCHLSVIPLWIFPLPHISLPLSLSPSTCFLFHAFSPLVSVVPLPTRTFLLVSFQFQYK